MKLFANKKLFKKIVILLVIITLVNALMPLYMVSADADEDFGGALFRPICQFFAGIGDLLISGLQWIFIGDGEIKTGEIPELKMSTYVIRYSPGVIFSNTVPGLDANFIKPGNQKDGKRLAGKATNLTDIRGSKYGLNDAELKTNYGFTYDTENAGATETKTAGSSFLWVYKTGVNKANFIYKWDNEDGSKSYVLFKQVEDENFGTMLGGRLLNAILPFGSIANMFLGFSEAASQIEADGWTLYEIENNVEKMTGEVRESTAYQLQKVVSKWYKALRMVSLVALLSVLVYVGIRIIISSTGQEKAKYKKMIGDWVAAICILFILNYIMAFTMDIVSRVTDVFVSSDLIYENGADALMTGIRNNINSNQYSGWTTFTYLILYLVLVIYTIIFTIHYLKRVVYLAFFTMIAPLIAVTYPIDRIKDGQAQAFGTWIKEYTFNAAIPVIHIIIYSSLVGSAKELVEVNPLYAIICISFLIPAEKFFRKLFGFDKATTSSQLGAATGGALIMNAINKMGAKSGKQAAAKAGASSSSASRGLSANAMTIASGDGGVAAPNGAGGAAGAGNTGGAGGAGAGGAGSAGGSGTGGTGSGAGTSGAGASGGTSSGSAGGAGGIATKARPNRAIRQGIGAVRRKYINKNTLKSAGRMARKVALGGAGAAIAGSAGLIAGISTGDFSNALKYGAVGAGAGFSGANYAGDKLLSGVKDVKETFQEGAIGQEEYNNIKSDKEFYKSDEFKNMVNNYDLLPNEVGFGKNRTGAMKKQVQTYRDNGITDTHKISTAMRLFDDPREGAYAIRLAENIGRSGWNNKNVREDYEKRYRASIPSGLTADKIWNSIEDLL